ncbi:MAG: hypothetical protein EZS28_052711, partial [Streblomastix strix]
MSKVEATQPCVQKVQINLDFKPCCGVRAGYQLFFVNENEKSLSKFNLMNGELEFKIEVQEEIICLEYNPVSQSIWGGTTAGTIVVYRTDTLSVIDKFESIFRSPVAVKQMLFSGSVCPLLNVTCGIWVRLSDGRLYLLNGITGSVVRELSEAKAEYMALSQGQSLFVLEQLNNELNQQEQEKVKEQDQENLNLNSNPNPNPNETNTRTIDLYHWRNPSQILAKIILPGYLTRFFPVLIRMPNSHQYHIKILIGT